MWKEKSGFGWSILWEAGALSHSATPKEPYGMHFRIVHVKVRLEHLLLVCAPLCQWLLTPELQTLSHFRVAHE